MSNVIDKLGGRKATALWASLLVVLVLLCLGRWILPSDLEHARMIVQESLGFLTVAILGFMGGNALEHAAKVLPLMRSAVAKVVRPSDEPTPTEPKP